MNPYRAPSKPFQPSIFVTRRIAYAIGAWFLLASIAVFAASCKNDVIRSPSVPGYPCGVMGILCDTGKCCDRDQACGIPNTASAGMCRFTGGDEMDSAAARGGPVMTPQWTPRS